jgi:hypothetical protein
MTDLDFDELDRAVNSLISSAPGTATKEENEEKTLTLSDDASVIPPSEPDTSTPPVNPVILSADEPTPPTIELSDVAESAETSENSETTEASEPEATVEEPTTPPAEDTIAAAPALAAKRSSGRFMDVVHPSSDMRSSTPLMSTPRPPVSSFGATITPPAETVTAVTPDPTPTAADWPDPLDFNGPKAEEVPVVAVGTPVTDAVDDDDDIDKIANDINASLSGQPEEAQTSPFLPDAKVEKRPLGAFSDEAPAAPVTPLAPAEVGIPESSGAPTSPPVHAADDAQVEQIDVPLPDELQSDLLSIESDDSTRHSRGNTGCGHLCRSNSHTDWSDRYYSTV